MAHHQPARVHYARIEGSREEKLAALDTLVDLAALTWQDCPDAWQAPFRPSGKGDYFALPLLPDLFPWSARGIQFSCTWPVAQDKAVLNARWACLANAPQPRKRVLLKETRDVRADQTYLSFITGARLQSLDSLTGGEKPEAVERFLYRSYDRQWCIADRRVIDMPRPALWKCWSERQLYLLTITDQAPSAGQAIVASAIVPDLNAFRGSCGGLVHPLYRTSDTTEPNVQPGLLPRLGAAYDRQVSPEDLLAYIYGILAQPAFTARFAAELDTRELRVPITKDPELFEKVRALGARLLWLRTYGERFLPPGTPPGHIPPGTARCTVAVPGDPAGYPESFAYDDARRTLQLGQGQFSPVSPEVFDLEVSGLKVVQSWLRYRMKGGAGKKSSPLDDINPQRWTTQFTTELLELLWVLDATVAGYPEQAQL
ncbi:MAG TPA: DNA methyltransferase, partial [Anaerolineae bacterium]|nr:DNA methyltransferase [Anaerolineae bacterium]